MYMLYSVYDFNNILPYFTLPSGQVPRHTSAEASIWAQCATLTDLMVEEIS